MPARDLDHVLEHTTGLWDDLRGASLFVTGGTGFIGRWILESFLHANAAHDLGASATVLTRDPGRFDQAAPHIARHAKITLLKGDVRSFDAEVPSLSHVLHLATEAGPNLTPADSHRTAVLGTEHVLALAADRGARRMLFTSSGAVYGPQPLECERIPETLAETAAPADATLDYASGKRAAESLCVASAAETTIAVTIARPFALVGPLLPLAANFAIGNFIRDALFRDRIDVQGDGTARRSYLYAADLAVWLWTILVQGTSGLAYNVGSEDDVSIGELASTVSDVVRPGTPVRIAVAATPGAPPARYIPSTQRAAAELDLRCHIALTDAIKRTAEWYSP